MSSMNEKILYETFLIFVELCLLGAICGVIYFVSLLVVFGYNDIKNRLNK